MKESIKLLHIMLIIKLQGGLGNQMFQYAVGRALAEKNNTKFKLDISHYTDHKDREYNLNVFNIIENFVTQEEIKYFKRSKKSSKRVLGRLYNILFANDTIYVQEKGSSFNSSVLKLEPPVYLDGYWQSEKYFKK